MKKTGSTDHLENNWERFRTGDQEAFAILYNRYIDNLYSYGTKLCKDSYAVKDALQELFIELYLNREKISISPENLKFYLLLALKRNLIKKLQTNRKFSHEFDLVEFEPEYSIEFQITEAEKREEITQKIIKALEQLPAKQKEAIYLRFNEGLEYQDIAGLLEIHVESVRKQVHRALKTIREIIKDEPQIILFFLNHKKG
ncbi:MAG: sigma-70 family RNA polymerase sigma factor [Marinilabiliales bacterium]|nr:sigma-70 family RNA polymerase sigma factor [Marinilabiliales bacterium]